VGFDWIIAQQAASTWKRAIQGSRGRRAPRRIRASAGRAYP
jgi:hypothetical protein